MEFDQNTFWISGAFGAKAALHGMTAVAAGQRSMAERLTTRVFSHRCGTTDRSHGWHWEIKGEEKHDC